MEGMTPEDGNTPTTTHATGGPVSSVQSELGIPFVDQSNFQNETDAESDMDVSFHASETNPNKGDTCSLDSNLSENKLISGSDKYLQEARSSSCESQKFHSVTQDSADAKDILKDGDCVHDADAGKSNESSNMESCDKTSENEQFEGLDNDSKMVSQSDKADCSIPDDLDMSEVSCSPNSQSASQFQFQQSNTNSNFSTVDDNMKDLSQPMSTTDREVEKEMRRQDTQVLHGPEKVYNIDEETRMGLDQTPVDPSMESSFIYPLPPKKLFQLEDTNTKDSEASDSETKLSLTTDTEDLRLQSTISVDPETTKDSIASDSAQEGPTPVKKPKINREGLEALEERERVFTAECIFEYQWPQDGGEWHILQEHVCEYLKIKSFKRKHPDLYRRTCDKEEKEFLRERGVVSETQSDLGLTALRSDEVYDLMLKDYNDKYQEYISVLQERQKSVIREKHKEYGVQAKLDKAKIESYSKKAARAAAEFNASLMREKKDERRAYFDLQTYTIHQCRHTYRSLPPHLTKMGAYPVALIPGQFQDHYRKYTAEELRYFPIKTSLVDPPKPVRYVRPPPQALINKVAAPAVSKTSRGSDGESNHSSDNDIPEEKVTAMEVDTANSSLLEAPKAMPDLVTSTPVMKEKKMKSSSSVKRLSNGTKALPSPERVKKISKKKSEKKKEGEKEEEKPAQETEDKDKTASPDSKKFPAKIHGLEKCRICKLRSTKEERKKDRLVRCAQCGKIGHMSCLDLTPELVAVIKTYPWQCMDCKTCVKCQDPYDEDKMMFCDICDRGYHTFCIGLNALPTGHWECVSCENRTDKSVPVKARMKKAGPYQVTAGTPTKAPTKTPAVASGPSSAFESATPVKADTVTPVSTFAAVAASVGGTADATATTPTAPATTVATPVDSAQALATVVKPEVKTETEVQAKTEGESVDGGTVLALAQSSATAVAPDTPGADGVVVKKKRIRRTKDQLLLEAKPKMDRIQGPRQSRRIKERVEDEDKKKTEEKKIKKRKKKKLLEQEGVEGGVATAVTSTGMAVDKEVKAEILAQGFGGVTGETSVARDTLDRNADEFRDIVSEGVDESEVIMFDRNEEEEVGVGETVDDGGKVPSAEKGRVENVKEGVVKKVEDVSNANALKMQKKKNGSSLMSTDVKVVKAPEEMKDIDKVEQNVVEGGDSFRKEGKQDTGTQIVGEKETAVEKNSVREEDVKEDVAMEAEENVIQTNGGAMEVERPGDAEMICEPIKEAEEERKDEESEIIQGKELRTGLAEESAGEKVSLSKENQEIRDRQKAGIRQEVGRLEGNGDEGMRVDEGNEGRQRTENEKAESKGKEREETQMEGVEEMLTEKMSEEKSEVENVPEVKKNSEELGDEVMKSNVKPPETNMSEEVSGEEKRVSDQKVYKVEAVESKVSAHSTEVIMPTVASAIIGTEEARRQVEEVQKGRESAMPKSNEQDRDLKAKSGESGKKCVQEERSVVSEKNKDFNRGQNKVVGEKKEEFNKEKKVVSDVVVKSKTEGLKQLGSYYDDDDDEEEEEEDMEIGDEKKKVESVDNVNQSAPQVKETDDGGSKNETDSSNHSETPRNDISYNSDTHQRSNDKPDNTLNSFSSTSIAPTPGTQEKAKDIVSSEPTPQISIPPAHTPSVTPMDLLGGLAIRDIPLPPATEESKSSSSPMISPSRKKHLSEKSSPSEHTKSISKTSTSPVAAVPHLPPLSSPPLPRTTQPLQSSTQLSPRFITETPMPNVFPSSSAPALPSFPLDLASIPLPPGKPTLSESKSPKS